jgi:tetratricopeptide (TPR) repeat protein
MFRALLFTLLPALAVLLAGCASAPQQGGGGVTRDEVLAGEPVMGAGPLPPLPQVDILALDQPMRDFLELNVDRRAGRELRLRQLVQAVISPGSFGLNYSDATRTAAGTFAARDGNCLSFTSMFVAMARAVGLRASFQQVDVPPDWEQRGESFVLSRHINVLVDLGDAGQKAVDFNNDDFKTSYDRERVSDRRAEAHYYNNVGVERMQAGDARGAFLYLRRGLQIDPSFAPLWVNLGALYLRAGATGHAEASYLEALRGHDADMVAVSNLARLYDRLGDAGRAAHFRELAARHRDNNPFYRYHQAREAYLAGNAARALRDLDFAIDRKPEEDSFLYLRAMVHQRLGDTARARADLERAEALAGVAAGQAQRDEYRERMERQLREQPR